MKALKFSKKLAQLRSSKIFIHTPLYEGFHGKSSMAREDLIGGSSYKLARGTSIGTRIDRARVSLARGFLKTECDYMLCIDGDMLGYTPQLLDEFVLHNKSIISALYFSKTYPYKPVIFSQPEGYGTSFYRIHAWPEGKMIEVDGTGLGFMLIKRKVIEKVGVGAFMPALIPVPKYEESKMGTGDINWIGGDLGFTQEARKAGFKVWVDTSRVVLHLGVASIGREHWEMTKELQRQQEQEVKKRGVDTCKK